MHQPEAEALLRSASMRVTRPRIATLMAVEAIPHADTHTVTATVRARIGKVSTQAVYDVLKALTDAGLVRRIEPEGSPARYERRVGDNHHHLMCRRCGVIVDVDCAVGLAPCMGAGNDQGFEINEVEITYWGICPECRTASNPE